MSDTISSRDTSERGKDSGIIRIGVISDTHMRTSEEILFQIRESVFRDVTHVIHAGDMTSLSVLDAFSDLEIAAVSGNCDGPDVRSLYPPTREIIVGGVCIGIVHGWGDRSAVSRNARNTFPDADVVVYGHTHVPMCQREHGTLLFNPGSVSKNRGGRLERSVGVLTIRSEKDICGSLVSI